MIVAASRHSSLPFVPAPVPDELLGSWLLRVAEFYGLAMPTFLARIAAWQGPSARVPSWFTLQAESLCLERVTTALQVAPTKLAAMAPLKCRPHPPVELGFCWDCLERAVSSGQSFAWNRRWMHPLSTVCELHKTWLIPIEAAALRRVHRASDLEVLVRGQLRRRQHEPNATLAPIDDAAWLQRLCLCRRDMAVPWGTASPIDLCRVINRLSREIHLPGEARQEFFKMPLERCNGQLKDYTVQDRMLMRTAYELPPTLQARQWVAGVVGHVLRHPASKRCMPACWPTDVVNSLATSTFAQWPLGSLAWISTEAMDVARRAEAEGFQGRGRNASARVASAPNVLPA